MAFSMFQATPPVCVQILGSMSAVIDKAAAHCAEKKYDEASLLTDRLFPDMFTLARQFRQVTTSAATSLVGWPAAPCQTSPPPMQRRSPK